MGFKIKIITVSFFLTTLPLSKASFQFTSFCDQEGNTACGYNKIHGYFGANCSSRSLKDVPTEFRFPVEALYLDTNCITSLDKTSFASHKAVEYLNLSFNELGRLSEDAFEPLSNLVVLDLSRNQDLSKIRETFLVHLPTSLKKLYLDHIFFSISSKRIVLPISSLKSLEVLSLSYCGLQSIPSFGGPLPSLEDLNLIGNPLKMFDVNGLAPLCQLKRIHMSPDAISEIEGKLECPTIQQWLRGREIEIYFKCKNNGTGNGTIHFSAEAMTEFNDCMSEYKSQKIMFWLKIVSCVLGVVVFGMLLIYVFYKCECHRSLGCGNDYKPTTVAKIETDV